MKTRHSLLAASLLCAGVNLAQAEIIVGNDLNSTEGANDTINQLYSGNQGNGGDQSLQFGDQLYGTESDDVIIGGLGIDILLGYEGNDVLIGGTEDFNPLNRDRAFGHSGNDVFIWTPGDGNDFFDGGEGTDVLIIGLLGELQDPRADEFESAPFFRVSPPGTEGSQDFDGIFIDPTINLPVVNPALGGFCEALDSSVAGMAELSLDHLVRFFLTGPANAFDSALLLDPTLDPDTLDNGLRIAVHLKNTEFLVCNARDGSEIQVLDLSQSPIAPAALTDLPANAQLMIERAQQILAVK